MKSVVLLAFAFSVAVIPAQAAQFKCHRDLKCQMARDGITYQQAVERGYVKENAAAKARKAKTAQ